MAKYIYKNDHRSYYIQIKHYNTGPTSGVVNEPNYLNYSVFNSKRARLLSNRAEFELDF